MNMKIINLRSLLKMNLRKGYESKLLLLCYHLTTIYRVLKFHFLAFQQLVNDLKFWHLNQNPKALSKSGEPQKTLVTS